MVLLQISWRRNLKTIYCTNAKSGKQLNMKNEGIIEGVDALVSHSVYRPATEL